MKRSLKSKLRASEPTFGSWLSLAHPAIMEIMVRAGFEWIVIDLEHTSITIREAEDLIRVADLSGCPPLVRVTWNDAQQIKRVMDAGAHGIVVPMVNSADDARAAVSAVRYPPAGVRGVGLGRASGYGTNFKGYCDWVEKDCVVVVQVEHKESVANLDEILAFDGVDAFIVGPYDLSASLGVPGQFENPEFLAAMSSIREVHARSGKPGGFHVVEPSAEQLRARVDEGYTFIAYGVDMRMLDIAARSAVADFKGLQ